MKNQSKKSVKFETEGPNWNKTQVLKVKLQHFEI